MAGADAQRAVHVFWMPLAQFFLCVDELRHGHDADYCADGCLLVDYYPGGYRLSYGFLDHVEVSYWRMVLRSVFRGASSVPGDLNQPISLVKIEGYVALGLPA
ncbi:MAG: hypothetical protein IPN81_10390 [Nitrosomonadales bacterium]|nr:hypothetical protein [Nitrosomonadales bacterium]